MAKNKFIQINRQEYSDRLDKVQFKTFFHETEWHKFLEKKFKWLRFEYYLYKNKNDEALLPIAIVGNKLISLPFCEYGGALRVKEFNLNEFNKDVLKEFGDNIKIKIHPWISEISGNPPGASSGLSSHWLHLENKSEQELWDSLRKTLRHEIRDAQERGLEIRRCKNQKELKRFYDLYVANLRRKRTVPCPWPLIQFLYKNAPSELLLALYKGRIIGGDLFLKYGNFVHYFLSASDYKYRSFSASHLLLWEKIKSLIGKEVILDLGASPRGSALEIFKRGWGGKEYPIYQIGIKRSEESLRSSKIIRFVWGLLPNFLIKKLSPYLIKYRI